MALSKRQTIGLVVAGAIAVAVYAVVASHNIEKFDREHAGEGWEQRPGRIVPEEAPTPNASESGVGFDDDGRLILDKSRLSDERMEELGGRRLTPAEKARLGL